MTTILVLLALCVVCRCLCWHAALRRARRVWHRRSGWLVVELWRRVGLERPEGDSQPYPRPRETRWRVWRLAGLPIWAQVSSVALPDTTEADLDGVPSVLAEPAFDMEFRYHGGAAAASGHAVVAR